MLTIESATVAVQQSGGDCDFPGLEFARPGLFPYPEDATQFSIGDAIADACTLQKTLCDVWLQ